MKHKSKLILCFYLTACSSAPCPDLRRVRGQEPPLQLERTDPERAFLQQVGHLRPQPAVLLRSGRLTLLPFCVPRAAFPVLRTDCYQAVRGTVSLWDGAAFEQHLPRSALAAWAKNSPLENFHREESHVIPSLLKLQSSQSGWLFFWFGICRLCGLESHSSLAGLFLPFLPIVLCEPRLVSFCFESFSLLLPPPYIYSHFLQLFQFTALLAWPRHLVLGATERCSSYRPVLRNGVSQKGGLANGCLISTTGKGPSEIQKFGNGPCRPPSPPEPGWREQNGSDASGILKRPLSVLAPS